MPDATGSDRDERHIADRVNLLAIDPHGSIRVEVQADPIILDPRDIDPDHVAGTSPDDDDLTDPASE